MHGKLKEEYKLENVEKNRGVVGCGCGCWPSCQLFGEIAVVGYHAVYYVAGFGNLPVQGRCCRNFDLNSALFLLLQERLTRTVLDSSLCRIAR